MRFYHLSVIMIGLIATTSLSGVAMAADVPEDLPEAFDWTGLYVGAHAGWGGIDFKGRYDAEGAGDVDFTDDGGGNFDLDDDGFLGGLQAGFNWQIDQFVLGIEGDISFVDWKDRLTNDDDERVSFDADLLISLRARAGLALDNLLVYATAGGAWIDANFEATDDFDDSEEDGDRRLDDIGFVAGGGAEYAFNESWSVRAEGLYYIFDQKESIEDLTGDTDDGDFIKLEDIFVVRAGVNFRF